MYRDLAASASSWTVGPELPPSYNQERQLAFDEWFRHTSQPYLAFHIVEALSLVGDLEVDTLEAALNLVIQRHVGLRAAFYPTMGASPILRAANLMISAHTSVVSSGLFRQRIYRLMPVKIKVRDLRLGPSEEVGSLLTDVIATENARPFDYEQAPLLRALLLRIEPRDYVFVVIIHHLLSDMISQRIFRRELRAFYATLIGNEGDALPLLDFHSPDFALWQHRMLHTNRFSASIDYWHGHWLLVEAAQLSRREIPRESEGLSKGLETLTIDPDTTAAIRTAARRSRVTLYIYFLTALYTVLGRLTGRSLVPVTLTFANRELRNTQGIIGWFAHSHLVGVELGKSCSQQAHLQCVMRTVVEASTHSMIPSVLSWRALKRPPQFSDVRIMFDSYVEDNPLLIESSTRRLVFSRFPITFLRQFRIPRGLEVLAIENGSEITLALGFDPTQFGPSPVRQILGDLRDTAISLCDEVKQAPQGALHG